MYSRRAENEIRKRLDSNPVAAILGPRQCGKTTLARHILSQIPDAVYLDLELPSDERKLNEAEQFFSLNADRLICIDEIQRMPGLFPVIRALCDRTGGNGRFLLLGSSSPELLRRSSETLAGRISYIHLTPFTLDEIGDEHLHSHWLRGGFPRSYLAADDNESFQWRLDFILTYLERDIPSLGFSLNSALVRRMWTMLAHSSGQIANRAKLAASLGVSATSITAYLDILDKTFMVRILLPYIDNTKKRIIKSPKIYVRDSGILHALLDIDTRNRLMGHPVYGQSWESYAIENIVSRLPGWKPFFYRTSDGTEIDLILTKGRTKIAVEFKASLSPAIGAGFYHSLEELQIDRAFIVCPFVRSENYPFAHKVNVVSIDTFFKKIHE